MWYSAILPYTSDAKVYVCPSLITQAYGIGVNYGHIHMCGMAGTPLTPQGRALATIQVPSRIMSSADSTSALVYCRRCWPTGPNATDVTNRIPLDRHTGKINMGMCDGHVETRPAIGLVPLTLPVSGTPQGDDFDRTWGHRLN
jgi:prepilin-type processing-associated H-X9-DG protein